jgi:2-polyprenyl-6-methoxyphenol hydroxylase-like FAD-dependent oxidoreductase
MSETLSTQVLIAGAGPVGLVLAMDLAQRGVDVIVVEPRAAGEPPNVKCNHVSARSMEIFRRLGLAREVRDAGLPHDFPHDVVYRTTMLGRELTRIPIPSRNGRRTGAPGPDSTWPTPEPPHRINQIFLEPILFRHAAEAPNVRILNRMRIEGFTQDEAGVIATARNVATGAARAIRAVYLVGCDGGQSTTRKAIGATFKGDAVVQRVQSTYINAPALLEIIPGQPGWGMFSLNPTRSGVVYAIDGRARWLIHNYLRDDEADFDSVDRDWAIRTILGVDRAFTYDIISKEDWFGRRLIADKFRDRRVFICGDAAHIWVPFAGYGMNAGIADAENLAWLLAAHLNGWAPPAILDAYEAERLPITDQVSRFAMNHAIAMAKHRKAVPADIDRNDETGDAIRREVGQAMYDLNVQQYCCAGLNFGYFYDRSPLIAYDGEPAPDYGMGHFTRSTVPGCRLPHIMLAHGGSLYDALGPWYTLLRFNPDTDIASFERAAAAQRVPLRVLDLSIADRQAPIAHNLLLARPDRHIAWRGDVAPSDPSALIARIKGAAQ